MFIYDASDQSERFFQIVTAVTFQDAYIGNTVKIFAVDSRVVLKASPCCKGTVFSSGLWYIPEL